VSACYLIFLSLSISLRLIMWSSKSPWTVPLISNALNNYLHQEILANPQRRFLQPFCWFSEIWYPLYKAKRCHTWTFRNLISSIHLQMDLQKSDILHTSPNGYPPVQSYGVIHFNFPVDCLARTFLKSMPIRYKLDEHFKWFNKLGRPAFTSNWRYSNNWPFRFC
jgi:hypothetical protein